jgi:hypothetical protein
LIVAGILASITSVAIAGLRAYQFARRTAALRKHLLLDPQWYARQAATVQRIAAGGRSIAVDLGRTVASCIELVAAIEVLAALVNGPARTVENLLNEAFPALRGILSASRRRA